MKKPRKRPKKRPDTIDRAARVLEQASDKPPQRTDDPSRDQTKIVDGVIKPLKHAD